MALCPRLQSPQTDWERGARQDRTKRLVGLPDPVLAETSNKMARALRRKEPMSDELPTAARVSDPGIRALYRLENRWQAWLDVEAALAIAQAELGIIPKEAAEAI